MKPIIINDISESADFIIFWNIRLCPSSCNLHFFVQFVQLEWDTSAHKRHAEMIEERNMASELKLEIVLINYEWVLQT